MRSILAGAIVALGLAGAAPASANVIYIFSGVTLATAVTGGTPEGTLSGSFTLNDALTSVVAADIVASAQGSFTGFEYIYGAANATATVSANNLNRGTPSFDLSSASDTLRLAFSTLTKTVAVISTASSYETESPHGNRYISSGRVVVPEPGSMAVLGSGLLGLVAVMRRRNRR